MIKKLGQILFIEKRLPWRIEVLTKQLRLIFTGFIRVKPNFIIIGAPKCGTTSLYNYMIQHPWIYPALEKEVRFFDQRYHKGINWYKANFPTIFIKLLCFVKGIAFATGESTPTYIFDPTVPGEIYKHMPNVKLIVLLRNPVDRAFSNYNMEVKNGAENLSFEDAIQQEERRLKERNIDVLKDGTKYTYNELHYAYKERGKYIAQLDQWLKYFDAKQILVRKSEELYSDPESLLNDAFAFLGLPAYKLEKYKIFYPGKYTSELTPETREGLDRYYYKYNMELKKKFNISWD